MNTDIVWCVVILIVLCLVGAVGCRFWLSSYENVVDVPFLSNKGDSAWEGFLAFWTFIIILQVTALYLLQNFLRCCRSTVSWFNLS